MLLTKYKKLSIVLSIFAILALGGCNNGSDKKTIEITPPLAPTPVVYGYDVKVINLTQAQPMSPVAVVLHNEGKLWEIGTSASIGLENLAESGNNTMVLADNMVLSGQSGAGVLLPGASETISISITDTMPRMLSLATMLVNTNDAFTGVNAMVLDGMELGESISLTTSTYDAGTEKNSEMMATIPGPAAGGEGFNAERDDIDKVAMHPGVVSKDDGLMESVLTETNRFDNPTLMVTIKRTK